MATRTTKGTEGVEAPSLNSLLGKLLENQDLDFAPPGWYTTKELAESWGVHRRYAAEKIANFIEAGVMQMKLFHKTTKSKRTLLMPHYAEVKQK